MYGGLRYSNNNTNTHYQFTKEFKILDLNRIEIVPIGFVTNPISSTLGIAISEYEEVYVLDYEEYHEKIATSIRTLLEKFLAITFLFQTI
jgi:hypothetical protein